jgi:hypothetical protein
MIAPRPETLAMDETIQDTCNRLSLELAVRNDPNAATRKIIELESKLDAYEKGHSVELERTKGELAAARSRLEAYSGIVRDLAELHGRRTLFGLPHEIEALMRRAHEAPK